MRKKLFVVFVISLLTLLTALSAAPAQSTGQGEWITNYTVKDLKTGQIIIQRDFQTGTNVAPLKILEGAELNVTLTVKVPMTVPDSSLKISTNMQHSTLQDRYWELKSTGYPVVNYNPNQPTVTFTQSEGNLTISCYGTIPQGMTQTTVGGAVLHNDASLVLIALNGPSGEILDQIKTDVIDAKIAEYQTLLAQRENDLQTLRDTGVSPAYIALFENIVGESQTVAGQGFTDNALALLNSLSVSEAPPSTGTSTADTFFLPAVGGLVAVAVIVGFLFVRTRGKANYVSQVVEDQIRDLEGLTLRASKVDKNLASGLETIEDRLKRALGE